MTAAATRPKLRGSVMVFQREERLQFVNLMELRVKEFTAPAFVARLLSLLDGTRSREDLYRELSVGGISAGAINDVLEVLLSERLLDRSADRHEHENGRYSRQMLFLQELLSTFTELPESPMALQARLTGSRAVVVGVGGAGSWVLQSLTLAGVGHIEIVDPDVIDVSNLNRQVLYRAVDAGRAKVDVAVDRCRELNPDVTVVPRRLLIRHSDELAGAMQNANVVVGCGDHPNVFALSDLIARACQTARVPHLVGGAYGGNLGIPGTSVVPGSTACWACVRAETRDDHDRPQLMAIRGSGRSTGSISPVTAMISNIMAWEVLRILLGMPLALSNQVRELDVLALEWRVRHVSSRPGCECGGPVPDAVRKDA